MCVYARARARVCMCVCVRVRACEPACVRACVCACVRACARVLFELYIDIRKRTSVLHSKICFGQNGCYHLY